MLERCCSVASPPLGAWAAVDAPVGAIARDRATAGLGATAIVGGGVSSTAGAGLAAVAETGLARRCACVPAAFAFAPRDTSGAADTDGMTGAGPVACGATRRARAAGRARGGGAETAGTIGAGRLSVAGFAGVNRGVGGATGRDPALPPMPKSRALSSRVATVIASGEMRAWRSGHPAQSRGERMGVTFTAQAARASEMEGAASSQISVLPFP